MFRTLFFARTIVGSLTLERYHASQVYCDSVGTMLVLKSAYFGCIYSSRVVELESQLQVHNAVHLFCNLGTAGVSEAGSMWPCARGCARVLHVLFLWYPRYPSGVDLPILDNDCSLTHDNHMHAEFQDIYRLPDYYQAGIYKR